MKKDYTSGPRIDPETGEIIATSSHVQIPFLRTAYNYDPDAASLETALDCPEPTLAQQQFREDSDINTLVERFGITGTMPQLDRIPLDTDFIPVTTYHEAANQLLAADNEFMKLPAEVRKRFDNDAGKFLAFTADEKNGEELDKMGLLKRRPAAPGPMEVAIVKDATRSDRKPEKGDPVT